VVDEVQPTPSRQQDGGCAEGGQVAVGVTDRDPQGALSGRHRWTPAADGDGHRRERVHHGVGHQFGHDELRAVEQMRHVPSLDGCSDEAAGQAGRPKDRGEVEEEPVGGNLAVCGDERGAHGGEACDPATDRMGLQDTFLLGRVGADEQRGRVPVAQVAVNQVERGRQGLWLDLASGQVPHDGPRFLGQRPEDGQALGPACGTVRADHQDVADPGLISAGGEVHRRRIARCRREPAAAASGLLRRAGRVGR
jgi:hypothetical protein